MANYKGSSKRVQKSIINKQNKNSNKKIRNIKIVLGQISAESVAKK
jgi:hypothetical protein